MGKFLFALVFGISTTALAQDPAKPPAQPQELDKDTQTRIRADRFAGGTGNITPEETANANVGAGPHMQFKPEGAARREPREADAERQAGRGASRGDGLESGDARDARRP
jgi:hypothetical protein